jgi:hypothetical protein
MKLSVNSLHEFTLVIVLLCSVHVFGLYYRLSGYLYDLIDLIYFSIAFVFLIKFLNSKKSYNIPRKELLFSKPILFFACALVLSSFSGLYYHGQNPILTLLASRYFLYFIVYFILVMMGVKKERLIKLIILLAIGYMIVFSLQLLLFPTEIVPLGRTDQFDRGFLRLRLEGVGFVTLSGFYCLNQFLVDKTKLKHLLFFLLCFFFIFILGFRTLLATFLISSVVLVFFLEKSIIRRITSLSFVVVVALVLSQLAAVQEYIAAMNEYTDQQINMGESYIRLLTYDFLFNKVNAGWGSLIFGNGRAFEGTQYGSLVLGYGAKNGYIAADLGLIGFSFYYGITSTLAFIYIFAKAIFKRLPKDSIYLNVYFLYLIISSFTTAEIFRAGIFGAEMVGLYLVTYFAYENKKQNRKF